MNDLVTNGNEIKQRIISEINKARQCIYIAMAYFTDRDIANALVEAKNKNVIVDIILSSNLQNETVKLILKNAGVSVHAFDAGDSRGIMHHKFCLIDNRITINGSYNYSFNASNNNVENITVSDDVSIYNQFLSEFERLKYNIDHQIAVNEAAALDKEIKTQPLRPLNIIDSFSQQLHNLVYSSAQIDTDVYKQNGYKNSEDSRGSIAIFQAEYNHIKQRIKTYATDEGLGSMKNVLISNISIAFESTKTDLNDEKRERLEVERRNTDLTKTQLSDRINDLEKEKIVLEAGNNNTGEKGLLQINKEIEKNKLEKRTLEQTFVTTKFWTVGNAFVLIGLGVFIFYLSIFFSSAVYKVFFEGNVIRALTEQGITPGVPQLVDANAIVKIFSQQGVLFGIIAGLFFLIPVLMSNLKIIGSQNKFVNNLMFWIGLLVFDILVSTMVAINTDEIKCLLEGRESTMKIWEVVTLGEFWLIFVFGMFPLIITHFLIDYIIAAYKKSQRDLVDADKNRSIKFLDEEMIELLSNKEALSLMISEKDRLISEIKESIKKLEFEMNDFQTKIDAHYTEVFRQITAIYNDYCARITSGRIFTDVILDSVITSYKSGFIEYLPRFYAPEEVANRVKEIEFITESAN